MCILIFLMIFYMYLLSYIFCTCFDILTILPFLVLCTQRVFFFVNIFILFLTCVKYFSTTLSPYFECVHMHLHVNVHGYVCFCVYICVIVCMHEYMYACVCMCLCLCTCIYMLNFTSLKCKGCIVLILSYKSCQIIIHSLTRS